MKDWIQNHYEEEKMSYDKLYDVVTEAWKAVPEAYMMELLATMPARCEAVIAANGMYTKY